MAEAVVQVQNLTKRFGTFTAVDGISFEIREGEILGLLGPNGAGKTTAPAGTRTSSAPSACRSTNIGKRSSTR